MRILLAVHTFFPHWRAGTEVYTLNIAKTLRKFGHDVQLVCYEPDRTASDQVIGVDQLYDGLPVHRIYFRTNQDSKLLDEYFNSQVEKHLINFYSRARPDVVHVIHAMHLSAATITAAKQLGLPVACTATDFWYICPTYRLLRVDNSVCPGPVNFLQCMRCYALPHPKWDPVFARLAHSQLVVKVLQSAIHLALNLPGLRSRTKLRNLKNIIERPRRLREILDLADVLIVPNQNTYRILKQNDIKAKRFLILEYGLALPLDICRTKVPSQKVRIGYIGTLEYAKGPHILVEAFQRLSDREIVELVIYGDRRINPEYSAHLERIAAAHPRIRFADTFPNERIGAILSEIDLLVIPSIWYENSPLVLYSAFATKTPVVVSNIGSLADAVHHGQNGLVFQMGNAEDLARQIELVLKDPSLLEKLRQGIPAVKSMDQNVAELLEIYAALSSHPTLAKPALEALPLSTWLESARREIRSSTPRIALSERAGIRWLLKKRGARFGDNLELCRCQYSLDSGRQVKLRFVWKVLRPVQRDLKVIVQLLDHRENAVFGFDHHINEFVGRNGSSLQGFTTYFTSFQIPDRLSPGFYDVRIGVWDASESVFVPPTRVWGWREDGLDAIRLRSIHVQ